MEQNKLQTTIMKKGHSNEPESSLASGIEPTIQEIFLDLASRFIINLPDQELDNWQRVLFQIQQAHWFYLDHVTNRWSHLPKFTEKMFCWNFFRYCPVLNTHLHLYETFLKEFKTYLSHIPVAGAIIISQCMEKVLMVQSYGRSKTWGFPRGKIDQNEDQAACALREVREEVGFDCSKLIQLDQFIEAESLAKKVRLYIITDVPESTQFVTQTKFEIGAIAWIPIWSLPSRKHFQGIGGYNFGNVHIFALLMRDWLSKKFPKTHSIKKQHQHQQEKYYQQQQQPLEQEALKRPASFTATQQAISSHTTIDRQLQSLSNAEVDSTVNTEIGDNLNLNTSKFSPSVAAFFSAVTSSSTLVDSSSSSASESNIKSKESNYASNSKQSNSIYFPMQRSKNSGNSVPRSLSELSESNPLPSRQRPPTSHTTRSKSSGSRQLDRNSQRSVNNTTRVSTSNALNMLTFQGDNAPGWDAEEMFRLNEQKFGVLQSSVTDY